MTQPDAELAARPLSRRGFLRRAVALGLTASALGSGLLAACSPSTSQSVPAPTSPPAAKPTQPAAAQPTQAAQGAPAQKAALSGTITVSYPDELGKKPPYVTTAVDQVKKDNPGTSINVDLQKIASGDYYTKLLLALGA